MASHSQKVAIRIRMDSPWFSTIHGSGDCHRSFPGGFFHQKGAPWSNFFIKLWGDLMRLFTWAPGRNPNGNRRNLRVCVKPCCRLCMVTFETITGGTSWTSMACGISCYKCMCVLESNIPIWKKTHTHINKYIYIHICVYILYTYKAIQKKQCMKTLPKDLCPGRIHWHHWHHINFTYITLHLWSSNAGNTNYVNITVLQTSNISNLKLKQDRPHTPRTEIGKLGRLSKQLGPP